MTLVTVLKKKMNTNINTPEKLKVNLKNWISSLMSKSFNKLMTISGKVRWQNMINDLLHFLNMDNYLKLNNNSALGFWRNVDL